MSIEALEKVFNTEYGDIEIRCPKCGNSYGAHIGKVSVVGPDCYDQGHVVIHIECENCTPDHYVRDLLDTGYLDVYGHEGVMYVGFGTWEDER